MVSPHIDNPPDHPRINRGAIKVTDGSRVSLQCSLSTTGNPPIIWLWYCNDVVVTENFSHRGKTTEMFFFATMADNSKECYCRAQGSLSISGILYDKNSSTSVITVSGLFFYNYFVLAFEINVHFWVHSSET